MIEEKNNGIALSAVKESVAIPVLATPQAIPAIVDSSQAAPILLSQAPPIAASDARPIVDKASSVVAPPLLEKK